MANPSIPFCQFGKGDRPLHFAHANGFHPMAYKQFLHTLGKEFSVLATIHRPFWQSRPRKEDDWHTVADDMIACMDQNGWQSGIGVGHSLGAVATLFAAMKRPDLFKKIVLIEPVFLPEWGIPVFNASPSFLKRKMNPLINVTLKRRDTWENPQIAFDSFREKAFFKRWTDAVIWDYLNSGLTENDKGKWQLAYSKEWEAHFFSIAPRVWSLVKAIETPVIGFRGENSNTLSKGNWNKWKKLRPDHHLVERKEVGHLIPFEEPKELAGIITSLLYKII